MKKRRRKAVVWIVLKWLTKYHEKGKIHEVPFDKMLEDIRKFLPDTKFSPAHLAWYKHHFLKGDLEFLYEPKRLDGIER